MRTLSTTQHADADEEGYTHALMLGRFDDAERVVDALQALVCADPQKGARNVSVLAEMRALISLHRGRSGEQEASGNIPQQLATFMARSEAHPSELQSLLRISYDVFCLNSYTT